MEENLGDCGMCFIHTSDTSFTRLGHNVSFARTRGY